MFRDRLPQLTPLRACVLAVLLLWVQAMGLAHSVAHASWGTAPGSVQASEAGPDTSTGFDFWPAGWGGSHQAGDAECKLIDQLGHADGAAPGLQPWLAPAPAAQAALARPAAALPARPAAAYFARAPPS